MTPLPPPGSPCVLPPLSTLLRRVGILVLSGVAQVLETRLRYAIHNCLAIDADDTMVGRNAAGMGWGEEP